MATPSSLQSTGLLNLEKELVCFICTEVLYQPLTLIDCLHTFCGSCLKEWFSHQYRKAAQSPASPTKPYTCPTCRAIVKDVQHNAMINTLLEMFLAANPDKHRSAEEKAEMTQIYKPGDNILPKVENRRRERRRREEDDAARRERRAAPEEPRQRTRREGERSTQSHDRLAPRANERSPSASDHEDRRDRRIQERQQRRDMRDRLEAAEARLRDENHGNDAGGPTFSPPPSSPRHPDAVEARSRARTVAHQASIRSLVSASDSGTGTGDSLNEAQLMQDILAEGLLDGINVDDLTEAEQDELSEIIAERYRQLHPQRGQRTNSSTGNAQSDESAVSTIVQETPLEEADRSRQFARGGARQADASPRSIASSSGRQAETRPPTSYSQTSQNEQNLSPPSQNRAHRRRASDQSGREQTSRTHRGTDSDSGRNAASRSATDLSDRPRTQVSATDGPRQLANTGRALTEPRQAATASELWARGGVTINRNRPPSVDSPTHLSPLMQNATLASTASAVSQTSPQSAPIAESETQSKAITVSTSFEEPELSCYRCQRPGIQYEAYKHCSPCDVDLCMRCYRTGRGCNHWFGFGYAAITRFTASHPRNRGSTQMELPHLLLGRQYQKPPADSMKPRDGDGHVMTSSDPASRLLEGRFCDRCESFANSCFWTCDYCNDGEWGFCNACVYTHHCCTHPLLPIAHKDFAPGSAHTIQPVNSFATGLHATPGHSAPSSTTSATDRSVGPQPDYVQLSIPTQCDVCTQRIPPSQSRYHCPSHPTPTPQQPESVGDYDMCTSCYHNLVKIGRIKREDGPAGWRKCPNGHRMIVTNFENDPDGGQRRVIVSDLVGGVKMTEQHIREWTEKMQSARNDQAETGASLQLSRGKWTWQDPAEAESATNTVNNGTRSRRLRSKQATITPNTSTANAYPAASAISNASTHKPSLANSGAKFPPSGGFGKTYVGLWSYYPEEGEEGMGELMFPKAAEITEVEEVNEDWSEGVYAGQIGFLAKVYVREVTRT